MSQKSRLKNRITEVRNRVTAMRAGQPKLTSLAIAQMPADPRELHNLNGAWAGARLDQRRAGFWHVTSDQTPKLVHAGEDLPAIYGYQWYLVGEFRRNDADAPTHAKVALAFGDQPTLYVQQGSDWEALEPELAQRATETFLAGTRNHKRLSQIRRELRTILARQIPSGGFSTTATSQSSWLAPMNRWAATAYVQSLEEYWSDDEHRQLKARHRSKKSLYVKALALPILVGITDAAITGSSELRTGLYALASLTAQAFILHEEHKQLNSAPNPHLAPTKPLLDRRYQRHIRETINNLKLG